MNQRTVSFIFFYSMLAISLFIVLWIFVINKGTLTVSASPPFTFRVAQKSIECAEASCSITLKPDTYTVTVERDGHFPKSEEAIVTFRGETNIDVALAFKPTLTRVDAIETIQIPPQPAAPALEFELSNAMDISLQGLYLVKDGKNQLITQFKKQIKGATYWPSLDGRYTVMSYMEATENGTESRRILIDLEEKRRFALSLGEGIKWLPGNVIALEQMEETEVTAHLYEINESSGAKEILTLPTYVQNIILETDGTLYYLAEEAGAPMVSFSEVIGTDGEVLDALDVLPQNSVVRLYRRGPPLGSGGDTDEPELLAEFQKSELGELDAEDANEPVKLLGRSEDGNTYYFLKGEAVYEIALRLSI